MTDTVILIVDDEPTNIDVLRAILQDDYRLKVAVKGEKALQIARASPPDLILLDVMMPEMDGYEVCRQLQADAATAAIPVIFVTGHTEAEELEKCRQAGGRDTVSKPIDPADLKQRILAQLG